MLSKKICKQCLISHRHSWSSERNRVWMFGYIYCPQKCSGNDAWMIGHVAEDPPDHCPYALEHVIHQEVPASEVKKCSIPECDEEPHAKGYCKKHYYHNVFKHNPNEKKCSVEGCERQFHARGLCKKHYRKIFKKSS